MMKEMKMKAYGGSVSYLLISQMCKHRQPVLTRLEGVPSLLH